MKFVLGMDNNSARCRLLIPGGCDATSSSNLIFCSSVKRVLWAIKQTKNHIFDEYTNRGLDPVQENMFQLTELSDEPESTVTYDS